MSSWFERGRPAILDGLAPILDKIDAELRAELRERDETRHAHLTEEIRRLNAKVAVVEKLELENRTLKKNLSQFQAAQAVSSSPFKHTSIFDLENRYRNTTTPHPPSAAREPLRDLSPNKASNTPRPSLKLGDENEKVDWELEYRKLWGRYQEYAIRLEETKDKAKIFRDGLAKWEKYALDLEKKLESIKRSAAASSDENFGRNNKRASVIQYPSEHVVPTSTESSELGRTRRDLANISFISNPGSDEPVGDLDTAPAPGSPFRRAASTPAVPHREYDTHKLDPDAVQGDEQEGPNNNLELPPLPRDNPPAAEIRVKEEPSSDVPVFVSERCLRKRKHLDGDDREPVRRIKSECSDSSGPAITAASVFFSPQESMDLDAGPRIQTPRRARNLSHGDLLPQVDAASDGEREADGIVPSSPIRLGNATDAPAQQVRGHQIADESGHRGLDHMPNGGSPEKDRSHESNHAPGTVHRGRLDMLLNGGPPDLDQGPILVRPTRPSRNTHRLDSWTLELNVPRRELPFNKSSARVGNVTPGAGGSGPSTPGTAARQTPSRLRLERGGSSARPKVGGRQLRKLPLSRLHLTDFKVNPQFNDGLNYAFDEVVRGRSDRAELPGCTDEKCCGKKFREMALNERDAAGPTLLQQPTNIKLLEDYLGDDAHRLGTMNRKEKEVMWVDAKVRDLANRFGRHKHRYVRPPSPAALWNVDMPSTQEFATEKEEMQREVRKQVEDRYRDAMRGNGRWLFRDE
ncbi:hypothetical protein GQ53DRAFT_822161 [Thozetella sp. PMI_491]|nr:hypothetical protein GQ53DRAFT_822161 [Thozetella sp. PMI_491]